MYVGPGRCWDVTLGCRVDGTRSGLDDWGGWWLWMHMVAGTRRADVVAMWVLIVTRTRSWDVVGDDRWDAKWNG